VTSNSERETESETRLLNLTGRGDEDRGDGICEASFDAFCFRVVGLGRGEDRF
jgi:hypothetical protein